MNNTYVTNIPSEKVSGNQFPDTYYDSENLILRVMHDNLIKNISLYSITGQLLIRKNRVNEIETSVLAKGSYIVKIVDVNDRSFSKKIIVN
jgi:hypothetical protein